jgi:hypothetical protein
MPPNADRPLPFPFPVPLDHPQLLQGLEVWIQLGLLSEAEVRQFCATELSCEWLPERVTAGAARGTGQLLKPNSSPGDAPGAEEFIPLGPPVGDPVRDPIREPVRKISQESGTEPRSRVSKCPTLIRVPY